VLSGRWRTYGGAPTPELAFLPAESGNMIVSLRYRDACQVIRLKGYAYKYFLNVLAVTATLSPNNVANGSTTKLGCMLNGSAR
jgi:hypothetical protein